MNPPQEGSSTEAQQPSTILAYPLPPLQYINSIDPENLPAPPAPITDGFYFMFGHKISMDDAIIAPLEAHGTKRLYPRTEYDHKKELKKINASILVNFLDLIDVLVKCPDTDKRIEKCNDLATLFINFHHLINELRPHQARETLRVWLTAQRKNREEIIKRLNNEIDKMTKVLEKFMEIEASNKSSRQLKQQQQQQQQVGQRSPTKDSRNCIIVGGAASSNSNTSVQMNNPPTNGVSNGASIDDILCEILDNSPLDSAPQQASGSTSGIATLPSGQV